MSDELKIIKRADSPTWWIRGTIFGQKVYESTRIPHRDLKRYPSEVVEYRDNIRSAIKESHIKGQAYNATFEEAARNYLKAGGSPRFLSKLIAKIGHEKLRTFSQSFLDDIAHEMYGHCTNETINRQFWTPFVAVWTHNTKGQNPLCPLVNWKRPKQKKSKSKARRSVDYKDAIQFINALSYPAAKVMFFLFWSGCRPMEAFDLETSCLLPEHEWIALDETKTDMPRGIPMHRALIPLLSFLKEQDGHVFLNMEGRRYPKGQKYNANGRLLENSGGQLATPIDTARKKTGLNIVPYLGRHTVSTNLIWPCGVHGTIKDEILGQAPESEMSKFYIHLPRKPLIDAINKLPYPDGLREDLIDPYKIRTEHQKVYDQKSLKPLVSMA